MSFLRDMVTRVFGEPVEGMQATVVVDPDDSTRIMHVNADGSLNVGISSGEATSTAINDGTTSSQKATVDVSGNLHTQETNSTAINTILGSAGDSNSTNTQMGRLTKIRDYLAGLVYDNTDRLKVSLYGKNSSAADTAIKVNSSGDQYVLGDFTETTGLSAGSLNADLVPSTDVSAYRWWSIHTFGTWSGTLTFQGSNDNSNWIPIQVTSANSSAVQGSTSGSPGIFHGPVVFRYLRIRMTSYTSGTANGVLELFTTSAFSMQMSASQAGTWTVQPGNTQNTTPWLVSRLAVAAYSLASTTTTGSTQNSGDISVGPYTEISIDINTTAQAGTSPTIQYFYERKGADGIYYVLWQSAVLTAATNTLSTSIGAGMAYNQSLGSTGRLRWVVGGSATPTFTHTANITGK